MVAVAASRAHTGSTGSRVVQALDAGDSLMMGDTILTSSDCESQPCDAVVPVVAVIPYSLGISEIITALNILSEDSMPPVMTQPPLRMTQI